MLRRVKRAPRNRSQPPLQPGQERQARPVCFMDWEEMFPGIQWCDCFDLLNERNDHKSRSAASKATGFRSSMKAREEACFLIVIALGPNARDEGFASGAMFSSPRGAMGRRSMCASWRFPSPYSWRWGALDRRHGRALTPFWAVNFTFGSIAGARKCALAPPATASEERE